jgi:hypothetical protein
MVKLGSVLSVGDMGGVLGTTVEYRHSNGIHE